MLFSKNNNKTIKWLLSSKNEKHKSIEEHLKGAEIK